MSAAGTWLLMRRGRSPAKTGRGHEAGRRITSAELDALYPRAKELALAHGAADEDYLRQKLDIEPDGARRLTERMRREGLILDDAERRPLPLEEELRRVDSMDGASFESWCAALLRKNGFIHISPIGGSGDQGVDLPAEKDGIRYAVQCKCYARDLGNTPVQEVNTGKQMYRCHVGAVMTNRRFTKGAADAAAATGTLLWDRDWLIEKINAACIRPFNKQKRGAFAPRFCCIVRLVHSMTARLSHR